MNNFLWMIVGLIAGAVVLTLVDRWFDR